MQDDELKLLVEKKIQVGDILRLAPNLMCDYTRESLADKLSAESEVHV